MKKVLSIVLAALLLCTMFAGCQKKEDAKPVGVVDGNVPEEIYQGAVLYADMMLQQTYGMSFADALDQDLGDGTTGADFLHEQALGMIKEFEAVKLFAIENEIELTEDDYKTIEEQKEAEYEAVGGKDAFLESLEASHMPAAFFDYVFESQYYYAKVSELFAEGGKYAPDAAAAKADLKANYPVRVKHVLVLAEEGAEDFAEKKALAEEIATRAAAGEDFEALITEYGEDPGMTQSPDGYLLSNEGNTPDGGSMVAEFTNASVALAEGGVSAIVPSSYGFHIIKRYPVDDAFIDNYYTANQQNYIFNELTAKVSELIEKVEIKNADALKEVDISEFLHAHEEESGIEEGSVELTPADGEAPAVEVVPADGIEQGTAVPAAQ